MNDTPTPRTNALLGKILYDCGVLDEDTAPEEWVILARELESELAEWVNKASQYAAERESNAMQALAYKAEMDELAACLASEKITRNHIVERAAETERELAEARDHVEHVKKYCMLKVGALQKQTCARMLAEFQRDTLAEALRNIRDGYGGQAAAPDCCEDCDFLIPIDEALATLKRTEP